MSRFSRPMPAAVSRHHDTATAISLPSARGAEASHADGEEFIRRLVFNILIGNADMHLKNWSLIYPDRCRAALAPADDFVSTIAYIGDATPDASARPTSGA